MRFELLRALLGCSSGLLLLAAGWFVGQRLTYSWNVRQKRRESQILSLQRFYEAYGEFFVVWKLWNRLEDGSSFDERRWELQKRSAAAEAIIESLLVKMSSEAVLTSEQTRSLGLFRQAFQQLRQCIRQGRVLEWHSSESVAYATFKCLAVEIAQILSRDWSGNQIQGEMAVRQLSNVTSNRWEDEWLGLGRSQ